MRINSIQNNTNFGMFSKQTAQKMLEGAEKPENEATVKSLIAAAASNKDYHIAFINGKYTVYTNDALGVLNQIADKNVKTEFDTPQEAFEQAENLKDAKYALIYKNWCMNSLAHGENPLDLLTTDEPKNEF